MLLGICYLLSVMGKPFYHNIIVIIMIVVSNIKTLKVNCDNATESDQQC